VIKIVWGIIGYLVIALVYYSASFLRQKIGRRPGEIEDILSMVFVPALLLFLLLLAPFALVYFWLYPERHRNIVDMNGTQEEIDELVEFCEYRKHIGICLRLAENFGWREYDAPPPELTGKGISKNDESKIS